jgi:hypothetical protein
MQTNRADFGGTGRTSAARNPDRSARNGTRRTGRHEVAGLIAQRSLVQIQPAQRRHKPRSEAIFTSARPPPESANEKPSEVARSGVLQNPQVEGHLPLAGLRGARTQRAPQSRRSRAQKTSLQTICKPPSPLSTARNLAAQKELGGTKVGQSGAKRLSADVRRAPGANRTKGETFGPCVRRGHGTALPGEPGDRGAHRPPLDVFELVCHSYDAEAIDMT